MGRIASKENPFKSADLPGIISFTVGTEGTNAIIVSMQVKDANGVNIAERCHLDGYLSDDAAGDSVVATAPDGTVAVATNGLVMQPISKKLFKFVTEADGTLGLSIGESGVKTCYLVICMPDGSLQVSGAITFA